MAKLSTADQELVDQTIHDTFIKVRQFEAKKKAIRDAEKTTFTKLANDTGISKEQFMEGYRRAQKEEGQLNLFDSGASRSENVIRDILAEQVTDEKHDRPEPGEKPAKAKKATKAAAKKKPTKAAKEKPEAPKPESAKASAEPPKKKVDAASPENLPGKGANVVPIGSKPPAAAARTSHRQQVQQPQRPPRANPNDHSVGVAMQSAGARPGAEGVSLADLPAVSGSGLGGNGFVDRSEHMSAEDYNELMRQGSDHQ